MKLGHESVEPALWKAEAGVLSNGTGRADNDGLLVGFDNVVVVTVCVFALLLLFSPFSSIVASLLEPPLRRSSRSSSCSLASPENPLINFSKDGEGGWPTSIDNAGMRVETRSGTVAAELSVVARNAAMKSARRIGTLALDRLVKTAIDDLSIVRALIIVLKTASEAIVILFVLLDRNALDAR